MELTEDQKEFILWFTEEHLRGFGESLFDYNCEKVKPLARNPIEYLKSDIQEKIIEEIVNHAYDKSWTGIEYLAKLGKSLDSIDLKIIIDLVEKESDKLLKNCNKTEE